MHADTSNMEKLDWLHPSLKKRKGNSDAVKVKQLNSPVTMSPAGAGSGKGEGPRETAGRSNLPTQARGRIRERRKTVEVGGAKKSISVAGRKIKA